MKYFRILPCLFVSLAIASSVDGQSVIESKADPSVFLAVLNSLSAINSGDVLIQHDELLDGVEDAIAHGTSLDGVILERKNSIRLIYDLEARVFARFSLRTTSATEISSQNAAVPKANDEQAIIEWSALVIDNSAKRIILIDSGQRTVLKDVTSDVLENTWRGFNDLRLLWKYGDQLSMNQWDGFENQLKSLCGRECKVSTDNRDSILTFRSPYGGAIQGMGESVEMVEEFRIDMQSMLPLQHQIRFESGTKSGSYRTVTTKWGAVESHYVPVAVSSRSRQSVDYKGSTISAPLVSSWKMHWFNVNGQEARSDVLSSSAKTDPKSGLEQKSNQSIIVQLSENSEQIDEGFVLKMVDAERNRATSLIKVEPGKSHPPAPRQNER